MKQGILLFFYFWILAGIAQFTNISALVSIGMLTLPLLVWILADMDMKI